jgi:hypothetical protein
MGNGFDIKTGVVFIRNFDEGLITTMGGYTAFPSAFSIDLVKMLGGDKENYFIDIPQASINPIPVIFGNPEAIIERQIYPSFVIVRENPANAMGRWHSIGQLEYRVPGVSGTLEYNEEYGVSGYSAYEQMVQSMPFDIPYQIQCYARTENAVMPMLYHVLKVYKAYSQVILKDSLGGTRTYTAFQESVDDISELVDVVDRVKAYSVSVRVEGEFTLSDPVTYPSVRTTVYRGHVKKM